MGKSKEMEAPPAHGTVWSKGIHTSGVVVNLKKKELSYWWFIAHKFATGWTVGVVKSVEKQKSVAGSVEKQKSVAGQPKFAFK